MKAFLVDPVERSIQEIEHSSTLADMRASIGCQWLEAVRLPRSAVLFMDENARLRLRGDLFRIESRQPGRTWEVIGRALIFGLDGDHEVDAPFTLEEVQEMVRFPGTHELLAAVVHQADELVARGICCCAHAKDPERFTCICGGAVQPATRVN